MENEFARLNTMLVPPKDIVEQAIKLSRDFSQKVPTNFVLDNIHFFPHITLYSPEYPKRNLKTIVETVDRLAHTHTKIHVAINGIHAGGDGSIYVELELHRSPEIQRLHQDIVQALNELREGRINPKYLSPEYLAEKSPQQRKNIQKYGKAGVMDLYMPHLTITALKDVTLARKIASKATWDTPSFTIDTMGINTMGEHGTCTTLIKQFPLS